MIRRLLCSLMAIAVFAAAIPGIAFAQPGDHKIEAYGNEFEIDTPEDWATGDLDGGKLEIDNYAGGGAIALSEGETEAVYTSSEIDMGPFEFLVMSWNADCPEGTWIEVTASVWLDKHQQWSNYLTWGKWSPFIKRASHAWYSSTESPYVNMNMDEFTVIGNPANGDTASKIRVQVILHRDDPAINSPVLWYLHGTVRTTGIEPTKVFRDNLGDDDGYECEVEVPQYSQIVRSPNIAGVMCSAATGAMLVNSVSQLDGAPLNVLPEEFAMGCFDFRASSFGNWSFTMAAAGSYGYRSYVDYSTIEGIKRHLLSGYAVGASVAYSTDPSKPNYLENAYGSTPGHLIVLRGFTVEDGVEYFISNDAYNPSNSTVRKLYRVDQFVNCWSRNAIYVVKPGKVQGVGNYPVERVPADLEEIESGKYALRLDVFDAAVPVVTPKTNSTYSSRHGFIAYIDEPEVFEGANPSAYTYINVASNSSDVLPLTDELLGDPGFRLYVANNDAHPGKLFIVDKDSKIKYLATVSSTDYCVYADEIGPNEKGIIFGETPVDEFLGGIEPAMHANMKLFASGTVVDNAADFSAKEGKSTGTVDEGDFLAVLAWDGRTFHKYAVIGGPALQPLNLWFEQDNVGLYHIDFPFTNVLHGYHGNGAMTWTSSNTGVARVDANGQVTPYNVGSDVTITVSVAPDGVYQAATASYKLSVLRGTIESFHWGTITHPKIGEAPRNVYTPSPLDQPDLFFFATNEPRFTWTGELENGKFKEGVAYSVEVRLQSNDYPGGNSAYFYAKPFTADMIEGLPQVGDSIGDRAFITDVTVTRTSNYQVTVKIDYSPLRLTSAFGYAIAALEGDVSMAGNSNTISDPASSTEADAYAAGDIVLKGNAKVGGDASATGKVTLAGNAKVAGTVNESVTALRFEVPGLEDCLSESGYSDLESLVQEAKAVPEKRVAGNYAAPNGAVLGSSGTYSWIGGDLTIGGNTSVRLDGVLLVSGSVTLKGNSKLVGSGVIISESSGAAVKVEGNAKITQDDGNILVIAPSGGVKVSGNASVEAAIAADGDVGLNANASSRPHVIPLAISLSGNVEVSGNGWLGARIYAPNGEIKVAGNAKVYGSLVGASVTLSGNNQVVYPVSLRD